MIASYQEVSSQTVTLDSKVVFPTTEDTLNHIRFKINNQKFGEKDTIIQIKINPRGFDICQVIIENDTINFLTKFRKGELYEIRQGCCCAAFSLQPKNNPRRGTVTFHNPTKRDLGLVIAEANIDTVNANATQTTFSHESAMCLSKPCSILITETAYFSDTYNYKNDKRDYDNLWKEQAQYILNKSWFHFLHGEKIGLQYNDQTTEIKIKLNGYLTDKEYANRWK